MASHTPPRVVPTAQGSAPTTMAPPRLVDIAEETGFSFASFRRAVRGGEEDGLASLVESNMRDKTQNRNEDDEAVEAKSGLDEAHTTTEGSMPMIDLDTSEVPVALEDATVNKGGSEDDTLQWGNDETEVTIFLSNGFGGWNGISYTTCDVMSPTFQELHRPMIGTSNVGMLTGERMIHLPMINPDRSEELFNSTSPWKCDVDQKIIYSQTSIKNLCLLTGLRPALLFRDLKGHLREFGDIQRVDILTHPISGRSLGAALVEFKDESGCVSLFEAAEGTSYVPLRSIDDDGNEIGERDEEWEGHEGMDDDGMIGDEGESTVLQRIFSNIYHILDQDGETSETISRATHLSAKRVRSHRLPSLIADSISGDRSSPQVLKILLTYLDSESDNQTKKRIRKLWKLGDTVGQSLHTFLGTKSSSPKVKRDIVSVHQETESESIRDPKSTPLAMLPPLHSVGLCGDGESCPWPKAFVQLEGDELNHQLVSQSWMSPKQLNVMKRLAKGFASMTASSSLDGSTPLLVSVPSLPTPVIQLPSNALRSSGFKPLGSFEDSRTDDGLSSSTPVNSILIHGSSSPARHSNGAALLGPKVFRGPPRPSRLDIRRTLGSPSVKRSRLDGPPPLPGPGLSHHRSRGQ